MLERELGSEERVKLRVKVSHVVVLWRCEIGKLKAICHAGRGVWQEEFHKTGEPHTHLDLSTPIGPLFDDPTILLISLRRHYPIIHGSLHILSHHARNERHECIGVGNEIGGCGVASLVVGWRFEESEMIELVRDR